MFIFSGRPDQNAPAIRQLSVGSRPALIQINVSRCVRPILRQDAGLAQF